MPEPYGLTEQGFSAPTFEELRAKVNARIWATISPTLDLSDYSYEGQVIAIVCEQVVLAWNMGEESNLFLDPDAAVDAALDAVCLLTGTFRRGPAGSSTVLALTGDDTTAISTGTIARVPSGPQFATTADAVLEALDPWAALGAYALYARVTNGGNAYVCIESGVAAGAGGPTTTAADITDGTVRWRYLGEGEAAADAPATATETGPLTANSGTITEFVTPVGGWLGVINLLDATPGRNQMSNAELRELREVELAKRGTGPVAAIEADILNEANVPGVITVTVFNNTSDFTDGDGVPPHSVEVLVMGGEDQDIWNTLHRSVGGGIRTHGTEVGTALDRRGRPHTYKFSRTEEVEIWIEMTVERDPTQAPADLETLIKDAIIAWGGDQTNGKNSVAKRLAGLAFVHDSVLDVLDISIGSAPAPTSDATVEINARQIAAYDSSRIAITFVDGEP